MTNFSSVCAEQCKFLFKQVIFLLLYLYVCTYKALCYLNGWYNHILFCGSFSLKKGVQNFITFWSDALNGIIRHHFHSDIKNWSLWTLSWKPVSVLVKETGTFLSQKWQVYISHYNRRKFTLPSYCPENQKLKVVKGENCLERINVCISSPSSSWLFL